MGYALYGAFSNTSLNLHIFFVSLILETMNNYFKYLLVFILSGLNLRFLSQVSESLCFIENKGQISNQHYQPVGDVLFSGLSDNLNFHLRKRGISYQIFKKNPDSKKITCYRIDLSWLDNQNNLLIEKSVPLKGYTNFYLESCPNGAKEVRSYSDVTYKNVYNGIDVHFYGKNKTLKYDYIVAPKADYSQIKLQIKGAKQIIVNKKGELIIETPFGEIQEAAPLVFQDEKTIPAKWVVKNGVVSFDISNANPEKALIIDPSVRVWGTYYGGSGGDFVRHTTTDESGNIYICGQTTSTSTLIATSGAHQTILGGADDSFLVKFDSLGNRLWATYYGGSGGEQGHSCATDLNKNIFLCGVTSSSTTAAIASGGHQLTYGGASDEFLVKFDSAGFRQWGTYYGGTGNESGYASCATDLLGNIYLTGSTGTSTSTIIATTGSHQSVYAGSIDGFVTKFDASGSRLWSTYYGGPGGESIYSCKTDGAGNIIFGGYTDTNTGTGIATTGSHQSTYGGGGFDAFLVKLNSSGVRQWGTYYGSNTVETGYSCAVDLYNNIYLLGTCQNSTGTIVATPGSHQSIYGGGTYDTYLAKFNSSGIRQWATFYGGISDEYAEECTTDIFGNVFICGYTPTATGTIIATANGYQPSYAGGGADGFLVKFDATGTRKSGTYYGGTGVENAFCCAADKAHNIYMCGVSTTTNNVLASPGSFQQSPSGAQEGFLVRFHDCSSPPVPMNITASTALNICAGNSTTLNVQGFGTISWYASVSSTTAINTGSVYTTPTLSPGTYTYYAEAQTCTLSPTRSAITITVNPLPVLTASSSSVCSGSTGCLFSSGANTYTWTGPCAFTSTQQSPCFTFSSACLCTFSVNGTDANGCSNSATVCISANPNPTVTVFTSNTLICLGQTATLSSTGAMTYTWNTSATGSVTVVSPSTTTTYTVLGTDVNGCSSGASILQQVSLCTSLETLTTPTKFKIYPNPFDQHVTIELNEVSANSEMEIRNLLGQVIQKHTLNQRITFIDTDRLLSGIYILKIKSEDNSLSIKLLKN